MGTGRELLLRPVVIHHGRRCSGQKGRIERTAEGLHLAMERREVQGRGGTQEAQGEASQEEGEESRGARPQEGRGGEEGDRSSGEEEGHGRGREEASRNACCPEGERWQKITGPCHGCPQGNVQV